MKNFQIGPTVLALKLDEGRVLITMKITFNLNKFWYGGEFVKKTLMTRQLKSTSKVSLCKKFITIQSKRASQ